MEIKVTHQFFFAIPSAALLPNILLSGCYLRSGCRGRQKKEQQRRSSLQCIQSAAALETIYSSPLVVCWCFYLLFGVFFEHVWSLINVLYISYLKWSGPEMTCWVGDQTSTNRLLVDMFLSKCVQPGWCFTHWMQLVLLFFGFDAVRNEKQQRWYNVMINYVHAFFSKPWKLQTVPCKFSSFFPNFGDLSSLNETLCHEARLLRLKVLVWWAVWGFRNHLATADVGRLLAGAEVLEQKRKKSDPTPTITLW